MLVFQCLVSLPCLCTFVSENANSTAFPAQPPRWDTSTDSFLKRGISVTSEDDALPLQTQHSRWLHLLWAHHATSPSRKSKARGGRGNQPSCFN